MTEFTASTNVTLAEQGSFKDKLPAGTSFMENNAFLVMGETEDGEEVSLVSCIFRVGGGKDGPWQVDDVFKCQTTFHVSPADHDSGMQNNEFIGNRTWATDDWNSGEVIENEDSVIWRTADSEHICRPPYWEIKGNRCGVEYDLLLSGLGDAVYHKGPYADLEENGLAGYEQPLCAEGTITAEGKTYTLSREKSFGCQENFVQPAWDLAAVLRGETYYWVWWAREDVRIFIYYYPSVGKTFSHVTVDGAEIGFSENGQSNINMEELEYWIDPKTRMRVPVKWHFNMTGPNGVIDLDIHASSRTFYGYLSQSGATIHYGLHSHSLGAMKLNDGRDIPLDGMRSYVEHGWTAIPLSGHAS